MVMSQWYAHRQMGCYYKLEEGVLYFSPMNKDGSRSEDVGSVEYAYLSETEVKQLRNIHNLLQAGIYAKV